MCEQHTSHVTFSRICTHILTVSHMTLAQGVVRIVSSMFHVVVRLDSLRLSTLPLASHSHLLLHPPDLHLHLPCGSVRREVWPTRPLSQSCSVGMLSRVDKPPDIWDTHGTSGNVFANPPASSSAPHPQQSNPWISNVSEHTSPHVMSDSQTPAQDQRCQSGRSARNSFIPSEGRFSKKYGADRQRLQISDLHFDKFPTRATFACWKIRFKTEVCTCSQFPTEAMMWIKEVEMVESVEDLKSFCSVRGLRMPDLEVLDAKIASALNQIIHNTRFKRKVSLEEITKKTAFSEEDTSLT